MRTEWGTEGREEVRKSRSAAGGRKEERKAKRRNGRNGEWGRRRSGEEGERMEFGKSRRTEERGSNVVDKMKVDYDSPWKEVLETYFPEFLIFFFPAVYDGIDWSRGYEFLDKELQQLDKDGELGRRLVDKLVKVWRRDGDFGFGISECGF